MSADLLDTALQILRFALALSLALFLPLVLQLVLLYSVGWFFNSLVYLVLPPLGSLLSLIGTPVHELSHAVGGLITLCRIESIKLLGDQLGPGEVNLTRTNPLSRVVVSIAPLVGATLVLWLAARYVIPGFEVPIIASPQLDLESAASLGTVLHESLEYIGRFIQTLLHSLPRLEWGNWRTYVGLYIALSVGLGLAPSLQDLRILVAGLPVLLLVGLGLSALIYLTADAEATFRTLQGALVPLLLEFSTAATYAFLLTSLGIAVLLPLRILQKVRGG
jgi:hypothetical protein